MDPRVRRLIITLLVIAGALGLVAVVVISKTRQPGGPTASQQTQNTEQTAQEAEHSPDTEPPQPIDQDSAPNEPAPTSPDNAAEPDQTEADQAADPPGDDPPATQPADAIALQGLHAVPAPQGTFGEDAPAPQSIGTLDARQGNLLLEFSRHGAGIDRIVCADQWRTAAATHQAEDHYEALAEGVSLDQAPPLPDDDQRYVLHTSRLWRVWDSEREQWRQWRIPALAAREITINGNAVNILGDTQPGSEVWSEVAPGEFHAVIQNADEQPVAQLIRRFELSERDIHIQQRVINLTDHALNIKWLQYGPHNMPRDVARYIDRRRLRFGYLLAGDDPTNPRFGVQAENDFIYEHQSIADGDEAQRVWPNDIVAERELTLSWLASTNRYFTLTVHPRLGPDLTGSRSLADVVQTVWYRPIPAETTDTDESVVLTELYSPPHTVSAEQSLALDFAVYAGPMARDILKHEQPYETLNLGELILYQMSANWCCAMCTFQWLAKVLLLFLGVLDEHILFDWGLAIIALVLIVRTLLHPLMKKGQIAMRRTGYAMQKMKPELDKLKEKYPDDPKKMQAEQLRLMREHGVNPAGCLGLVPMLLQIPIWTALYAMLYFAFELRHQPAFFGLFQQFGGWEFLADLSSPDRFIAFFDEPQVWSAFIFSFDYSSINVLPLLMGVMFFLQQKYMTPPTTNMNPEQEQMQKMMKIIFPIMMPLVLYSAPSGLTLYIFTSSTFAIIESRYIRAHLSEEELERSIKKQPKQPKKKPRDPQGRAYAEALERAKQKKAGPPKKYKKRK